MILIIICILVVFALLVLMRSAGIVENQTTYTPTEETEKVRLYRRYCELLDSGYKQGIITEEEYQRELKWLNDEVEVMEHERT